MAFPKKIATDRTRSVDQHLLAEIRDELVARPLAHEISRSKIDLAKKILAEQELLDQKLARVEGLCKLLLRATAGINATEVDDETLGLLVDHLPFDADERALLAEAGALIEKGS